MRRRKHNPIFVAVGISLIITGALVLFARVFPPGVWWFCFGAALVVAGVMLLRC